jgi:uncharacterized protein (TIGR03382 family)
MFRHSLMWAVLAVGTAGTAAADAPRATYRWTDPSLMGSKWSAPAPANVSHIIFMNNCAGGCTLHSGYDDSTTNTSSVPNGTANISAYAGSSTQWNQLVQCVQQSYAPFNVQIVTTRPAAGTDYHMAIVAGSASEVGESQGVLGVSPFTCGYIQNSISFTFANEEPSAIMDLCWTVAQETAHSWGLDHKYDDRDPMTYLSSGPSMKTFQNQAGACGEYSSRQCNCTYDQTGSAQENSYQLIMATFGPNAPDTSPPTVAITAPANGAAVMAGFPVSANVMDNVGVQMATLKIDGATVTGQSSSGFSWTAPTNLGQGSHHVEVTGVDLAGNTATAAVDVTIGHACTQNSDCTDSSNVCVGGHCVPGPGAAGGLGTKCTQNSECASGQCASDSTGDSYCVVPCSTTMNTCPGGFGCVASGGTDGVCWPGADGGGGCASNGSNGAVLMLLGLGAVLITRRRK